MDPHLHRLRSSVGAETEVAVIVRLPSSTSVPPPALRVVSRFGPVLTARVRTGDLDEVRRDVVSIKAPLAYHPDHVHRERAVTPPGGAGATAPTSAAASELPGTGTVLGIIDWGLDVRHPVFRDGDGGSRVDALWDQRHSDAGVTPEPFGYGSAFRRDDIDGALSTPDPLGSLGYRLDGVASHGTHTTSLAAGSRRAGFDPVAPGASIVFVHFDTWGIGGRGRPRAGLGDSVALLEGLAFIDEVAGDRPCAINLSIGRHAGPHDGSTLVEQAIDEICRRPGRVVVQSAGNYHGQRCHVSRWVPAGGRVRLPVELPAGSVGHEIDIWADHAAELSGRLVGRDGRSAGEVISRRSDPNNGRDELVVVVDPVAANAATEVVLEVRCGTERGGRVDVWIERHASGARAQARFARSVTTARVTTTGSIANGRRSITVGALDAECAGPAPFSSSGPTVDGRAKPDLMAPGTRVVGARLGTSGWVEMSGTSMAAPRVCGAALLVLQDDPELTGDQVRDRLRAGADPLRNVDPDRVGAGALVIAPAPRPAPVPSHTTDHAASRQGDPDMTTTALPQSPTFEEAVRQDAAYVRWIQASLNAVATAGLAVDGVAGPQTRRAVASFQATHQLVVDGVVGPRTEAALVAAGAPAPPAPGGGGGGSIAPVPIDPAHTPARNLHPADAFDLVVAAHRRGELVASNLVAAGGAVTIPASGRLIIAGGRIAGVDFVYQPTASARTIDNLDPRLVVALHRLAVFLRTRFGVTVIRHLGIGHGRGPADDCHNSGRAIDLSGLVGTIDGTAFQLGVKADWGQKGSLAAADPLARQVFGDLYQFATGEFTDLCPDRGCQGAGPGSRLGGRSFIIHPEHPGADLRKAHQDHVHLQIGPTRAEPPIPPRPGPRPSSLSDVPLPSTGLDDTVVRHWSEQRFTTGADVDSFFRTVAGTGFVDWFVATQQGRGAWAQTLHGSGSGPRLTASHRTRSRFTQLWDRIPIFFAESDCSLVQFAALMSIIVNETGGELPVVSEHTGKRGLEYTFNATNKRSYNTLAGNRTAATLFFDDAAYRSVHGERRGAAAVLGRTDLRSVWAGTTYPSAEFPTDPDHTDAAFIREADFYKFRGRGFIQTTGRTNYLSLIAALRQQAAGAPEAVRSIVASWPADDQSAATISTGAQWDALFGAPGLAVPALAVRLHSAPRGYLRLATDAATLGGDGRGSIYDMGRSISGSQKYGRIFRLRVLQLLGSIGR